MKTRLKTLSMVVVSASMGVGPVCAEPPAGSQGFTRTTPSLKAHLSNRLDFRASLPRRPEENIGFDHMGRSSARMLGDPRDTKALLDWDLDADGLRMTGGALQRNGGDEVPMALEGATTERNQVQLDKPWRPYIGLGWDYAANDNKRLDIQLDMGLVFDNLGSSSGEDAANDAPSLLDQEALLRQEFESFRYSPAFSAGLEYRF